MSFYYSSYSEKFFYGQEGDQYESVPNMDQGIFKVENSDYYSYDTDAR